MVQEDNKIQQSPQGVAVGQSGHTDMSKAGMNRPALMENSYHVNHGAPLVPGAQPRTSGGPASVGGHAQPIGAGPFMGSQYSASRDAGHGQSKGMKSRFKTQGTQPFRKGLYNRGTVRVTSAPAAALKLLDHPTPGNRVVLCEAPPSCRVQHGDAMGGGRQFLHGKLESNENIQMYDKDPMNHLIYTPTGSAALDTMPSTPTEAWQRGHPGDAIRHTLTPPSQHMPNAYSPYQHLDAMQPPMPVLRLSEVLPGQQAVQVMGPGLRPLQPEAPPGHFQMPQMPQKPLLPSDSTSASGGSGSMEGSHETIPRGAVLGSPELPSRGSALHAWRACKPCAFIFNEEEGCGNGQECEFCHLCEPGDRKSVV